MREMGKISRAVGREEERKLLDKYIYMFRVGRSVQSQLQRRMLRYVEVIEKPSLRSDGDVDCARANRERRANS